MLNLSWTHLDVMSNAIIPSYENEPCRMPWIGVHKHHNPKWSLYLCCQAPSGKCKVPFTCRITPISERLSSQAPCRVSQCVPWLKSTCTHANTRLLLLPTSVAVNRPLCKFWVSWHSGISCRPLDHPKHTDTPSVTDFTQTWNLARIKVYYQQSTRNNRAFASMVGLASDSPRWSTTWPGLDVIRGRE